MVFAQRTRILRWAGQPSTFYLLLNVVLLTGLIHYWSGWSISSQQFAWSTAPLAHTSLEADVQSASLPSTVPLIQTHAATVPPPVSLAPPTPASAPPTLPSSSAATSLAGQLPGFCNLCGPEDVYCRKYGIPLLARSRGFEGANARFHRVLRDATSGKPTKIAILGGSVSCGQGVTNRQQWLNVFGSWWKTQFTGRLTIQNGAVAATGTGYMSMCFREHIDEDADIIITEFAINDQRLEESAESYEWLLRQLLLLPKRPAVLNLQVFGLDYQELTSGGDLHTAIAQYYDTPVISLRNALLPQILRANESRADYFNHDLPNGQVDYNHINHRGHEMAGDFLSAYTQRQLCAIVQQDMLDPAVITGTAPAAQLPLDLAEVPRNWIFSHTEDAAPPELDPYCASTRAKKHPLVPSFNDGRWSNYTWTPPDKNPRKIKSYILAKEAGALISFKVPIRGGLGRVRLQYLRSFELGLGMAKCWMDDDKKTAVLVDGYWQWQLSIAAYSVITWDATVGEHTLWCEMIEHSNSPDKRTEFRIIGVDAA